MRRAAFLAVVVWSVLTGAAPPEPRIAVVVHRSRTDVLRVDDVAAIFLRRRRFWNDGAAIVPLNREPDSTLRQEFTRRVLGDDVAHLTSYWNQQYFNGVFPPTVVNSAAAVKRWIATDRDAIGYLDTDDVDASVRVVLVVDGRGASPATHPPPPTATPPQP